MEEKAVNGKASKRDTNEDMLGEVTGSLDLKPR